MTYISNKDYWLEHAKKVVLETYGDNISYDEKNKDLLKFGRNALIQTAKTTLMTLPTGIVNETYLSSNLITTVSSSSAADVQTISIEGHTISAGVFTFVVQTATLIGQTQVTLTTPLARISRMYNTGLPTAVDLVGRIYGYETDTTTAGVPDTDTKVHIIIEAGLNTTEKAATTISDLDYFIVTGFYSDCLEKVAAYGIVHFEVREKDGVFLNKIDKSASSTSAQLNHSFLPYLIVPPNSDLRLRVSSNAGNQDFSGGIQGILAKII